MLSFFVVIRQKKKKGGQIDKKKSVQIIEGRTEWRKMERLHLAPRFVAMTAGCVGTPWSWQCPHLWHHGALGSETVHVRERFWGLRARGRRGEKHRQNLVLPRNEQKLEPDERLVKM